MVVVKEPPLILFLGLTLGTPKTAGVMQPFRPLLGPREGRGEVANFDSVPLLGTPDKSLTSFVNLLVPLRKPAHSSLLDVGGPLSWGYGLPRFGVAPRVGDMDSHALAWPLELGIWTPTLWHGPLSWGYGLPHHMRCAFPRFSR